MQAGMNAINRGNSVIIKNMLSLLINIGSVAYKRFYPAGTKISGLLCGDCAILDPSTDEKPPEGPHDQFAPHM
jgi:hypothetical protein